MKYEKEIVCEPTGYIKRHLSSTLIKAEPFATAKIKQAGYGLLDKGFWLQRVAKRGFHVFVFTLSGSGRFIMEDGTEITVSQGDAFISWSSGQGHYEATEGSVWEMIWFTVWDSSPRFLPTGMDYEIRRFSTASRLNEYFQLIMEEELYLDSRSREAIELYESLFLITVERSLGIAEANAIKRSRLQLIPLWEKVSKTIDKPWSVSELCREANMSKAHLNRLCNELYHTAPGEKIREMKMLQASLLLRNSVKSISEIAEDVGYFNISTFSNAFSQYFGMSPRQYRKG
jgi:AraC-type DNA-binding domain-containing proteins